MAAAKKKAEGGSTEISVPPMRLGSVKLRIVGTQPLYQNRMTAKAKMGFLVGTKKKTAAERIEIKHDPIAEFRDSAEIVPDGPTALGLRVVAVKAAMSTAALETPGLTKASTQRLLFMPGDLAPLYGTPSLKLDIVRSADAKRTPDIRSRAFLPRWGAEIEISFVIPQLSVTSVATLLCNAGVVIGVGDNRQEKGKGSYGVFRVLGEGEDDDEWNDLVENHGRPAQLAALAEPQPADRDTEDLLDFWRSEVKRRAA
jgi:hypothetical protein